MTLFLYFAYGSNMLTERLQQRCPSAKPVGTAIAKGRRLVFAKKSRDGSGKATLIEDSRLEANGVLFEISESQRDDLDRAEGRDYQRCARFKVFRGSEPIVAFAYLAKPSVLDTTLTPYDWYRALVLAGAIQHRLPDRYIETLCKTEGITDTNACRPSRLDALHVLETAGFGFLVGSS